MAGLKVQGKTIAFPHRPGMGGPGSFQSRFENALRDKGWNVSYASQGNEPDIVFVVGGTKRLCWLLKMKFKGVPIIYRLDGLAWLHRYKEVALKSFFLSEYRNASSKFIHAFLASHIIYQSLFVQNWWERSGWRIKENHSIIYNGVEIPESDIIIKEGNCTNRLVVVEGTIDYSPFAVDLLNELAIKLPEDIDIEVYGRFADIANEDRLHSRIQYYGSIPREKVFKVLQNSVYLSLDVNPACPNTVVEAMACGSPVVGFDTGALKELVIEETGCIVPYGSDPWQLDYPDVEKLIDGINIILMNWEKYSENARKHAVQNYDLQKVVQQYLQVIEGVIV